MEKANYIYWIGILPHVYFNKDANIILLYNTETGDFVKTSNIDLVDLVDEMHIRKNLGVVLYKKDKYKKEVIDLINKCLQKKIFIIYEGKENMLKPIHLMPILNLQQDITRGKEHFNEKYLMENLLNVYVYINGICSLYCEHCKDYFKQTNFCTKHSGEGLDKILLISILNQLPLSTLSKLCFIGGNISLYTHLDFLLGYLNDKNIKSVFTTYYLNFNLSHLNKFKNHIIEILFTFPIKDNWFNDNFVLFSNKNIRCKFLITSQIEYNEVEYYIIKYGISNNVIIPFYDKNNRTFFEENVYLTEIDILSYEENKQRLIFSKQKINTNNFGTLYIFSNGDVKSNILCDIIGNIKNDSLQKIVKKELIENTSWRILRDKEPCNNCVYQYLCPSPSNYECVIGNTNLCNI